MGIRLYPNTRNVANLEIMAGVPAGTAASLEAVEAHHQAELVAARASGASTYDLGYRQWQEIDNDPALGAYSAFLLYGWGKFSDPHGVAPGYSGSVTDPVQVALLFRPNGIQADIALTEGVHWC